MGVHPIAGIRACAQAPHPIAAYASAHKGTCVGGGAVWDRFSSAFHLREHFSITHGFAKLGLVYERDKDVGGTERTR